MRVVRELEKSKRFAYQVGNLCVGVWGGERINSNIQKVYQHCDTYYYTQGNDR